MPFPKTKKKVGRPAKVRETLPRGEQVATLEPLTAQLGTMPDGNVAHIDQARLAEYSLELWAIVYKLRMFDAQMRRGAVQGLPRTFLIRAQNVVAYINGQADEVPNIPPRIS